MAGDNIQPVIDHRPPSKYAYATQLTEEYNTLLRKAQANQSKKPIPFADFNALGQTLIAYIEMTKNSADEETILRAIESNNRRQETMHRSVTHIENCIDATASECIRPNGTVRTYAEIAKTKGLNVSQWAATTPTVLTEPSRKTREITVKLNNKDSAQLFRDKSPNEIRDRINKYFEERGEAVKVEAAGQMTSGDTRVYANNMQNITYLRTEEEWVKALGTEATLVVPTYGIVVHGIQTWGIKMEEHKDKIIEGIKTENAHRGKWDITWVGWLKRNSVNQKASSMTVEFTNPNTARTCIDEGLIFHGVYHDCVLYDKSCRRVQCFNCQNYGHMQTHCKNLVACGHCGGTHNSRDCYDPNNEAIKKCAACGGGKHNSWSSMCPENKKEEQRRKTAMANKPRTYPIRPEININRDPILVPDSQVVPSQTSAARTINARKGHRNSLLQNTPNLSPNPTASAIPNSILNPASIPTLGRRQRSPSRKVQETREYMETDDTYGEREGDDWATTEYNKKQRVGKLAQKDKHQERSPLGEVSNNIQSSPLINDNY